MSRTTQEKFLDRMQALADDLDLDLVVDKSYANVGKVRFERKDAFETVSGFGFSFQSGYASFEGFIEFHESPEYMKDDHRHVRGPHVEADELENTIAYIERELSYRLSQRESEAQAERS